MHTWNGYRRCLSLAMASMLCCFNLFIPTASATEVRGSQSGRWTSTDSPYIVTGDLIVPKGMTLTIEPGVLVKFAGYYSLKVDGTLRAIGSPASRIVFTSINDPEFSATDSNSPIKLQWAGIEFTASCNGEQSRLENCAIKHSEQPLVVGPAIPRRIESILISDCGSNAILIDGKSIPFQDGVEQDYFIDGNGISGSVNGANVAAMETRAAQPLAKAAAPKPQDRPKDKPEVLIKDEFSFGEMTVVTASKRAQKISEAPAVIDVITAAEIKNMGAQTLEDVTAFLTSIQTPMSRKGYTHFWVRGLGGSYNNKSLLLIDGYPLRPLWFSHHPLDEELPLHNVERIELMRGPGSALYGANALAGVINVITKNPAENTGSQFSVSGGNKETGRVDLSFGKSSDLGSIGGSISYFDTQGDPVNLDKYAHSNTKFDARNTVDMIGRAQMGELKFGVFYNNYKSQYRTQDYNEDLHYDKRMYGLNLEIDHAFSEAVNLLSRSYYNRFPWSDRGRVYRNTINEDPDLNIANQLDIDIERLIDSEVIGSDLQLTWQPNERNTMIGGVNFEREQLKDFYEVARFNWYEDQIVFNSLEERDAFFDDYGDFTIAFDSRDLFVDTDGDKIVDDTLYVVTPQAGGSYNEYPTKPLPIVSDNVAFYLQDTWQIHQTVDLIAGFRYDNHQVYGSSFSPRSGLIWRPSENFTTKLLYNRAFRAPAHFELYLGRADNDNPGNLTLKPEHLSAVDLEFNLQISQAVSAKLGLFTATVSDFIRSVDKDTIRNLGSRRSQGVEMGLNYRLNKNTYAFANFSVMEITDLDVPELILVWRTPEANKSKYSLIATGKTKDLEVPNVAPILANIGINFGQFKYANFNLMLHYEGERNRPLDYHAGIRSKYGKTPQFLENNLGAYTVANLNVVTKNFLAPWEFSLSVRNLFDTKYYSPGHEPAKYYDVLRNARSILVKANYQF